MGCRARSRSFVASAAALLGALGPTPAEAESFHLVNGTLEWRGREVGELSAAAVEVQWPARRRALVHYEDANVQLRGEISTTRSGNQLLVGVGRETPVVVASGWTIGMLAETWAPALDGGVAWTKVALPHAFPARSGWIRTGGPPATGSPELGGGPGATPSALAVTHGAVAADQRRAAELCVLDSLIGRHPGDPEPWHNAQGGPVDQTVLSLTPNGRWAKLLIVASGFALEGYAATRPAGAECPSPDFVGLGMSGSVGCGDGVAQGRHVWLEAGTRLYAGPYRAGAEPFATLRQRIDALELEKAAEPILADGVPTTLFLVEMASAAGRAVLYGYLDRPNRQLRPVDPQLGSGGGFGHCTTADDPWPPAWY
jgi:hypothetical protein